MHTALYSLLGLTPEATKSQIRKAYLLLALKTHPDRKTNASEAEIDTFKNIKQAYETLYDDEKRREYDTRPPTPPLESSFPRSRPQPYRSNASERDPSSSSRQPPLSRSERTTFGPSPRHSSYPYPPSPHGSDSSDSGSGDDTEHDASDSESTLSEPEEEPPHHFRTNHYHQPHPHPHPHRWTDDGDFHDYVDGEEDSVGLATKEAEWAEQDRRENAKRESIREGLRNGGGSHGRTTTPGPSRPSSPVREGGRSRPSAGPRSRSYATPPYESVRTSSPHTTFHDDDEYRSPRDDRRTRSYPSAEEGRRDRMAGSRTRPSSPERERVELRGTRSAGFAQDSRIGRGPSYDHLPSPPMPPARPLSSNFNRSLPPSPPYTHLRPNHLPPPPPLLSPQSSRPRPVASWKTLDYNNSSPKGFSGPPPSSYFPGPLPSNSRQQQQPRASTSPFPRGGPPPPQFIASPRSNSSPMPRMAVGRTRSGEMMARRR